METVIKILIVEHNLSDIDLILHELKKGGINCVTEIVTAREEYEKALRNFKPDIILSDYSLPAFSGPDAFKMREELAPHIPFIFVSGYLGEDKAVELIKGGATDYVLKDRLFTLTVKVNRALKEAQEKQLHKKTEEEAKASEKKFRHTLDNMLEGIQIHDFNWRYIYVNDALVKSSTYKKEELLGYTLMEKYPGVEQSDLFKTFQRCMNGRVAERMETEFVFPNGTKAWFELSIEPIPEGISVLSVDRTEQKNAKEKLLKANRLYAFISAINQSIVHIADEQQLLENTCNIAIDIGQFEMAWIAILDENGKLMMRSTCGNMGAAKEMQKYSGMDFSQAEMQDTVAGRVLNTGKYVLSNDIKNDPAMERWKEEHLPHRIKANLSLPIQKFGKVVGVLGFNSCTEHFFDEGEIALLQEAAGDISFALENFEREKQHRKAEELVVSNEKRFRAIIENSADMITLRDLEGNVVYMSPSVTKVLGYELEEGLRTPPSAFIHPDDFPGMLEQTQLIRKTPGSSFVRRQRLRHKNGTWIWCEGTITNMLNEPGIHAIVSNFRDISRKKALEERHEFDRDNLTALINNTKDLMWSVDRNFNLITSNEPFDQMGKINFGKSIEKGNSVLSASSSPEMLSHFKLQYERAFAGETYTQTEHFEVPVEFWSEISYYPIRQGDEIIGTACHSHDITERKLAERQLSKSEERYRQIVETAQEGIWLIDENSKTVFVNKRFSEIFGYSFEEMMGKSNLDLMGEESRAIAKEKIEQRKQGISEDFELMYIGKGGKRVWANVAASPIMGDKGNYLGGLAMLTDITKRKRSEVEIIGLNTKLQVANGEQSSILNTLPANIALLDRTGTILSVNEAWIQFAEDNALPGIDYCVGDNYIAICEKATGAGKADADQMALGVAHVLDGALDAFALEYACDSPEEKRWFRVEVRPLLEEKRSGAVVMHINITERKMGEERLKHSEEMLNAAQAIAQSGSWELDFVTNELMLSEETCRIFGFPPEENRLTFETWTALVHPEDIDNVLQTIKESQDSLTDTAYHHRIIRRDGTLRYIYSESKFEFDAAGKPTGLYGITQDVTEKKLAELNLQDAQDKLWFHLENTPLGFIEWDNQFHVKSWSKQAEKIFGWTEEEFIAKQKDAYSQIYQDDFDWVRKIGKQLLLGELGNISIQHRNNTKDGSVIWCEWFISVVKNKQGAVETVMSLVQDITKRKNAEEKVVMLNENLEDRIQERTAELTEANSALEAFSYSVSHDLRAPVRSVLGFVKIIHRDFGTGMAEELKEMFTFIENSGLRMNAIIDGLLDLAKAGKEKMVLEEVDLTTMFESVWDNLSFSMTHRAQLILPRMPVVMGDSSMLHQVIVNLLANAIKYSCKKKMPQVVVGYIKTAENTTIYVEDNGAGFDMKFYDRLFGAFQRLHSTSEFEGTGVGLMLVKRIIERHGGTMWAEARVNEGATFYFSLPIA